MADALGSLSRTHTCGALRPADVGADVVLLGWIHRVRDLGGLLFLDVRDRHGITQVMVPNDSQAMTVAKRLRSEYVVAVLGAVRRRDPETVNPKIETGEVEVVAREIRLLNEAKTPPFPIADETPVSEDVRLRYRYLDLRRPNLQRNIGLRHRVTMAVRRYFDANGFWEIETPILNKSTPEGARDYLVPSRVHPGSFFALPQSPQLFKQILMVAGMDRYFQIVKCFRDEDLRADRQPEFTQIDVEISFAHVDLVFGLIEPLVVEVFREIGVEVPTPFRRMPYAEAMARYGSDKPDLRFGMEIADVSSVWAESGFNAFRRIVSEGGVVRALVVPGGARYSRSELDGLVDQARAWGAVGILWARRAEGGVHTNVKAAGEATLLQSMDAAGCGEADLLLLAGGRPNEASELLGNFRVALAKKENLIPADQYAFAWIVDFPLFEWDPEGKRWDPMHHPFTAPHDDDQALLETDPSKVRAKAYDLVLNGSELGGGSIRIHDAAMQSRIFRLLNISDEQARARFGFFLDALQYGTPPHGGIALGLDRLVALMAGESSIREVIAFPKTAAAVDLMSGAPSPVDPHQLEELKLRVMARRENG
ncbi:MAG TPA: aspartate--tRNA ligase [Vicinamibacterales bacterium]